jgi:hypothetical protein
MLSPDPSRDIGVDSAGGEKKFQIRARIWQKTSYTHVKRGLASEVPLAGPIEE